MDESLNQILHEHLEEMVRKKTNLTKGMIEFYSINGKKEDVNERLGLDKGNWNKKLELLYPGEFVVENNIVNHRKDISETSKKSESKVGNKKIKRKKKLYGDEAELELNITRWQQKVEQFSGKAKSRKVPSNVKKMALGMPCPTCGIQMTNRRVEPQAVTNEHIIPLSLGGDNTVTGKFPQVIAMCKACNTARNQVVMSVKSSNKGQLVRFLITQVYGNVKSLNESMMKKFLAAYQSVAGRKINSIPILKSDLTLLIAGFCGNNPSPIIRSVYENLNIYPERIIVLIEQKDSELFEFDKWNHHTAEVQLIPSGNDNLQVSALRIMDDEKSKNFACLITPEKSSISFEKTLLSRRVPCLKTGGSWGDEKSWLKRAFSLLLPWNWLGKKTPRLDYEMKSERSEEKQISTQTQPEVKNTPPREVKTKERIKEKAKKANGSSPRIMKHPLDEFRITVLKRRKTNTYKDGFPISAIIYILKQIKNKRGITWKEYFLYFELKEGTMEDKATTIMEMSGIEYEINTESGGIVFVLSDNQPKMDSPKVSKAKIKMQEHEVGNFSEPQIEIIQRAKDKIIQEIRSFEKAGKKFKAPNLSRVYGDFGGSSGFKETLNIPNKTKLLEMFEMLFGDYFIITGTHPNIIISTNDVSSDEQE